MTEGETDGFGEDLADVWEKHYALGTPEQLEPFGPLLRNIGESAIELYNRTSERYEELRAEGGPINEFLDKLKTPAGRIAVRDALQDMFAKARTYRFVEDPSYRPNDNDETL